MAESVIEDLFAEKSQKSDCAHCVAYLRNFINTNHEKL